MGTVDLLRKGSVMTDTDTFVMRAEINGALSAMWFIAALLFVSGLIMVIAAGASTAAGGVLGAGVLAMLAALTVQAIKYPRK